MDTMYNRSIVVRLVLPAALVALAATARAGEPASAKQSAADVTHRIDAAIEGRLKAEKVKPAGRADDAEFLRRVYLDLTGHVPPAARAAAFLDDRSSDKRARLIDELLASPMFGKHMADVWESLLVTHNSDNRLVNFEPLRAWLEGEFNKDRPWDALVRDLLTASGTPEENGAVVYFLANTPVDRVTDNATKLFLGVQLQCAQCHNHPFTKWKQDEYWGMAAFFLKTQARQPRPLNVAKGETGGVMETGNLPRGKRGLPESAKLVPAKFLGGEQANVEAREPLRPVLAAWITKADNPYFSRAMVNRVWSQLFGRGFVNPVDDMHDANPASHPELLADLAKQFAADGFDLKNLYRAVCNSEAYQRTSKTANAKADVPAELFARMAIKMLTPEQLFDSLTLVLANSDRPMAGRPGRPGKGKFGGAGAPAAKGAFGAPPAAPAAKDGADKNKNAMDAKLSEFLLTLRQQMQAPRNQFVTFFKVEDADATEYQAGIPQALRMMNAPQLNTAMANSPLVRSGKPVPKAVEEMYLATLARRPTQRELERAAGYVGKQRDLRQGLSDVLWALLNSSEFSMNH
jgi:hypothetical protein